MAEGLNPTWARAKKYNEERYTGGPGLLAVRAAMCEPADGVARTFKRELYNGQVQLSRAVWLSVASIVRP